MRGTRWGDSLGHARGKTEPVRVRPSRMLGCPGCLAWAGVRAQALGPWREVNPRGDTAKRLQRYSRTAPGKNPDDSPGFAGADSSAGS